MVTELQLKHWRILKGNILPVLREHKSGLSSNHGYWVDSVKGEVKILNRECKVIEE